MKRREFIQTTALAATGLTLSPWASARPVSRRKPNILIILTDQQNIDTIAAHRSHFDHPCHGSNWVKTPNLDRLAKRGVSFMESHVNNPVCSPQRASLFTGRMSTETGVPINNRGIDQRIPNMGQWLAQESNYERYYCGKWHAGGPWNYPSAAGPRKIPGFECIPIGDTHCGDFNDYAVSGTTAGFLNNYRKDQPFLFVAGLMNPHDICFWTPPLGGGVITPGQDVFGLGDALPPLPPNLNYDFAEPYEVSESYDEPRIREWSAMHWRNYAYEYYRMVEKVDADVGRILDAVDSREDETVIIFTSDHGEGLGRHERIQKWHPFEHSLKVPLIISWPGTGAEDYCDRQHLVQGVDLMATVCDIAGIAPPPHCHGRSLVPLIRRDSGVEWSESVYAEFQRTGRVLRTERYKYVRAYRPGFGGGPFERDLTELEQPYRLKDGRTVEYVPEYLDQFARYPEELLFDMLEDPWEMTNLATDSRYADILRDHDRLMVQQWESRLIPGRAHTIN
jgi:arylsulfatase A-like enzyme